MNKQNKGITLIALVITIAVLVILVGVSVSVAINTGLIANSKKAVADYDAAQKMEEQEIQNVADLVAKYTGTTFKKQGTGSLAIGDEVIASNGEHFYVLGEGEVGTEVNENTQNDILLLAKYNLKKENGKITLKQDTTTDVLDEDTGSYSNACAFSSTNYWDPHDELSYPLASGKYPDLNNESEEDGYPLGSATSIVTTAKAYGESLGVKGRLMTVEEVVALGGSTSSNSTSECPGFINGDGTGTLNFWLGSANYVVNVWGVNGEGDGFSCRSFNYDFRFGVRPVVEISKSSIK